MIPAHFISPCMQVFLNPLLSFICIKDLYFCIQKPCLMLTCQLVCSLCKQKQSCVPHGIPAEVQVPLENHNFQKSSLPFKQITCFLEKDVMGLSYNKTIFVPPMQTHTDCEQGYIDSAEEYQTTAYIMDVSETIKSEESTFPKHYRLLLRQNASSKKISAAN